MELLCLFVLVSKSAAVNSLVPPGCISANQTRIGLYSGGTASRVERLEVGDVFCNLEGRGPALCRNASMLIGSVVDDYISNFDEF